MEDNDLDSIIQQGDFQAARQIVIDNTPNDPMSLASGFYNTANLAAQKHQAHEFAIKLYELAQDQLFKVLDSLPEQLGLSPRSLLSSIFNNMGTEYKRLRQWDMALQCYHDAYAISPDYVIALLRLALLRAYIGQDEEAKLCYEAYLAKGGNLDEAIRIIDATSQGGRELKKLISN